MEQLSECDDDAGDRGVEPSTRRSTALTSWWRRRRLTEPAPLLRTSLVKPGAFVVPYGTISAVELDLLDVMDKVVVDDWREAQSGRFGALRAHVDTGRLSPESLHAELGEIVTGRKAGTRA